MKKETKKDEDEEYDEQEMFSSWKIRNEEKITTGLFVAFFEEVQNNCKQVETTSHAMFAIQWNAAKCYKSATCFFRQTISILKQKKETNLKLLQQTVSNWLEIVWRAKK